MNIDRDELALDVFPVVLDYWMQGGGGNPKDAVRAAYYWADIFTSVKEEMDNENKLTAR